MKGRTIKSTEVIRVIRTVSLIGDGTTEDPHRVITEYWSLDGTKLAEVDPMTSGDLS